ncbi:MAG: radical SAM protein [Candidatus Saliniplasma sp.]
MLERYEKILSGLISPYYQESKKVELEEDISGQSIKRLWKLHDEYISEGIPPLELKNRLAHEMLRNCELCEKNCGADRESGEKGYCGVLESNISSEFLHFGEERVLIPSHTVFFSGCNFECVFCQNWEISQRGDGGYIEPKTLAFKLDKSSGKNINWVGGDPTPNIAYILGVLSHMDSPLPHIWNSNMYLSEDGMNLLAKLIDVYLTDFKYGNDECAERLSGIKNYTDIVKRNHKIAEKTGDLIIRHLVLPDHIECCTIPLLEWIDEELSSPAVNIMTQYRPSYRADRYPEINRYLSSKELETIKSLKEMYSDMII